MHDHPIFYFQSLCVCCHPMQYVLDADLHPSVEVSGTAGVTQEKRSTRGLLFTCFVKTKKKEKKRKKGKHTISAGDGSTADTPTLSAELLATRRAVLDTGEAIAAGALLCTHRKKTCREGEVMASKSQKVRLW